MTTTPAIAWLARCQRLGLLLLALACLVSVPAAPSAAQAHALAQTTPQFIMTDLGTLGGAISAATGLNNRGDVIGSSRTASDEDRIFVWQDGVMTDLGIPSPSEVRDINDLGQVVGYYGINEEMRAFLWQNGVMEDLGTLGGCCETYAAAINERGQIVGYSITASGQKHAFVWQAGIMTDLGVLGGDYVFSQAVAINNQGQVIGTSYTTDGRGRAFLWQQGVMTDLGSLGSQFISSTASAINEQGQIVGTMITADRGDTGTGDQHGFLWQAGVLTDLGFLGAYNSSIGDINEQGQIVGTKSPAQGFIWQDGVMTDLGNLGTCCETSALEINEQGQVVGISIDADWMPYAFVWQDGVMTALGQVCGPRLCSGSIHINERGQIVSSVNDHAVLWTPSAATPEGQISALKAEVDQLRAEGVLTEGQRQALIVKLDAALSQLAEDQPAAAAQHLHAFCNQVRALQQAGVLSEAQAEALRDPALTLIAELTGADE